MRTTYGKTTKVGVIWAILGRGWYEAVSIPASMVVARLLTPEEFGVVAAANFFVQIAQRLTNFGFNMALVQRKELSAEHTSTVFVANVALGLLLWAGLSLSAPWLAEMFNSKDVGLVLPVAASGFAISAFSSVSAAILVRELRFRDGALIDGLCSLMVSVVGVWMAWTGWGLWSLIWAQVSANTLQMVLRFVVAGWRPSLRFSWGSFKELLSFGIGLHFKRLLDSVALNVDNLVVGRMLGMAALGYYDKSFTMMNRAVSLLIAAGPTVSFRIFAIIHGEDARFRKAYRKVLLASTLLTYPAFVLLIAIAPNLFLLLFGPQWDSAVLPFRLLCVAGMLKVLNALASSAAQGSGQVWGEVQRQCAYLVLIVFGAGLGSVYGLRGASAGVLVATVLMTGLMQHLLRSRTVLSWSDILQPQVPALICSAGLGTMLAAASYAVAPPVGIVQTMWHLAGAAALSAAFMLAFLRFALFEELRIVIAEIVEEVVPVLGPVLGVPRLAPSRPRPQR